eukprot:Rmarinus@m.1597
MAIGRTTGPLVSRKLPSLLGRCNRASLGRMIEHTRPPCSALVHSPDRKPHSPYRHPRRLPGNRTCSFERPNLRHTPMALVKGTLVQVLAEARGVSVRVWLRACVQGRPGVE